MKNRKYQLVIEREIIEASGGFFIARLSSKQYGRLDGRLVLKLCRDDNPNYIGGTLNTKRYEANKAIFLPSLTYWLRVLVASLQCVYPIVLHSIICLSLLPLSIDLGYPSAFYIFLAT